MELNEEQEGQHPEPLPKILPFNNLFLNAGVVHGFNEWWMYLFGICAAMFGYFLFQFILLIPLINAAFQHGLTLSQIQAHPEILFDPDKIGINKNALLALLLGMFIFTLGALYIAVTRIHHKPFRSIITAYDRFRASRFFFGFAVWAVFIVISTLIAYAIDPSSVKVQFDPLNFFILLIVSTLLIPIQTSTEEIIFRGYMVQGLAQITRNGITPLIVTSVLFGLVHMSNPEAKTYGWQMMLPYYASFGFFLGAVTLIDEGLELAMGIHCANNLISGLLVTTPNGVLKTDAIFVASGENPLGELLLWFVMASLTFIIFWRKYRWKNFNLLIK